MSVSMTGSGEIATPVESSNSAMTWGPIFGGAAAAIGVTLILLLLGSGVGLTMVSPWSGQSSSLGTVGVTAAIWLVVVQWLSSGLGGYITGRLRTKWAAVHTDEVFFRDTAHGFISWALATIFVAGFLASSLTSLAGAGAQAVGSAASAAGTAAASSTASAADLPTAYFTDALLRPEQARAEQHPMILLQRLRFLASSSTVLPPARSRMTTRPIWPPSSLLAPVFPKPMHARASTLC